MDNTLTEAQKIALAALQDIVADSAVDPATRVSAAKAILYFPQSAAPPDTHEEG